ncbi:MAG: alkane 1-monooxygenase [Bacteroidota bacterium]
MNIMIVFRPWKYLFTLSFPLLVFLAFQLKGPFSWLPFVYAYMIIPLLELFIPADSRNMSKAEEALIMDDSVYDWMVYIMVPLQYMFLGYFLWIVTYVPLELYELAGLISAMGIMCGVYGINVGHELGHRRKSYERVLAKLALLSSMYMHFFIEHNRGHHKNVSTPEDPASARYGEVVYSFWFRTVIDSYRSAWRLEAQRLKRKKLPFFSLHNEMIRFQLFQLALLAVIYISFGLKTTMIFLLVALIGILLLETVNYIEHYGLSRKKKANEQYERTMPHHSWNSNHVIGRLLLFELSRHSDHHFIASRKYQILRHHDDTPQMPTGYPGMMLLSLLPPLWFRVMHPRIQEIQASLVV